MRRRSKADYIPNPIVNLATIEPNISKRYLQMNYFIRKVLLLT